MATTGARRTNWMRTKMVAMAPWKMWEARSWRNSKKLEAGSLKKLEGVSSELEVAG
jgi:hypothetical protein